MPSALRPVTEEPKGPPRGSCFRSTSSRRPRGATQKNRLLAAPLEANPVLESRIDPSSRWQKSPLAEFVGAARCSAAGWRRFSNAVRRAGARKPDASCRKSTKPPVSKAKNTSPRPSKAFRTPRGRIPQRHGQSQPRRSPNMRQSGTKVLGIVLILVARNPDTQSDPGHHYPRKETPCPTTTSHTYSSLHPRKHTSTT